MLREQTPIPLYVEKPKSYVCDLAVEVGSRPLGMGTGPQDDKHVVESNNGYNM